MKRSPIKTAPRSSLLLAGVFLISAAIIMLQIISSRFTKIAFMHDFQFIIISFTIWGLGIGGIISYYFRNRISSPNFGFLIGCFSIIYSLLVLTPFLTVSQGTFNHPILPKILFFASSLVCYICAGIIISQLFTVYVKKIPLLYGFSLLGSATGALLVSLLLDRLGNSLTVYFLFFIALLSSFIFSLSFHLKKVFFGIIGILAAIFMILVFIFPKGFYARCGQQSDNVAMDPWYGVGETSVVMQDSNSFSQLDIMPKTTLPGLDGYLGRIHIDCTGVTFLAYSGQKNKYKALTTEVLSAPLLLKRPKRLAIIGSGAGIDVMRAVLLNSYEIDAFEINPLIIQNVKKLDPQNVYTYPEVHLVLGEGRGNLAKSNGLYDMVYIPGTKRFGDIGIAPYAFVSNYLYTEEAVETYMNKLNTGGILAIADPALFVEKYAQAVNGFFKSKGLDSKTRMITLTGSDDLVANRAVLLAKMTPFTLNEKEELRKLSSANDLKLTILSDEELETSNPVTDDHPFFWNLDDVQNSRLMQSPQDGLQNAPYEKFFTVRDLYVSSGLLGFIYIATVLFPFISIKKKWKIFSVPFLFFYTFVGAGYVMLQLFTIEKLTFFLGSPIYALSVVLFSFLLWGGLGSIMLQRIRLRDITVLKSIFLAFLIVCAAYFICVYRILPIAGGLPLLHKIIIVVFFLIIPSSLCGMIFPLGLRYIGSKNESLVPWMWGVDGIASVLGGILFVILSFLYGFSMTAVTLLTLYSLAFVSVLFIKDDFV